MDDYGSRIRGYLYPPATGKYTFWIAGDDHCQLRLSTDGTPANVELVAEVVGWTNPRQWDKFTEQESAPLTLTAGRKYYIEVLHKEGTGGDHVAVAWSGPGIDQQVIDGRYLSPPLTGLYGDINGSGTADLTDLIELCALWLEDHCALTSGVDLDGDCVVEMAEFSEMGKNWLD